MDTLLIPCWRRPEFLHHCLSNLVATGELDSVHVIFKPDTGHSRETIEMIERWEPKLPSWEIASALPARNRQTKQSLNVLSGYLYAASLSNGLVFMVEEDIMVGRDFFRFHRALHYAEPGLFCSLSPRNHNRTIPAITRSDAYYLSHGDFCSWGTCFRREVILEMIAPHVNEEYLARPQSYCAATWPDSIVNRGHIEQDGLIRRIQDASDRPTAYPHVPRAFHAGWYGYNRADRIGGRLEQRIEKVGSTIYDPAAMRKACLNEQYFNDSRPEALELDTWTRLQRIDAQA